MWSDNALETLQISVCLFEEYKGKNMHWLSRTDFQEFMLPSVFSESLDLKHCYRNYLKSSTI